MPIRSFSWYSTYISFPVLYHITPTCIPPATLQSSSSLWGSHPSNYRKTVRLPLLITNYPRQMHLVTLIFPHTSAPFQHPNHCCTSLNSFWLVYLSDNEVSGAEHWGLGGIWPKLYTNFLISKIRFLWQNAGVCSFALLPARGAAVLQPPAFSYSHYHLLVLFNQGIKSFQDSNYNDLLSAGSEARQHARHPLALRGTSSGMRSACRDGSDSAPTLTASTSHIHSWQAQPRANVHGWNAVATGRRASQGACRNLMPSETSGTVLPSPVLPTKTACAQVW